MSVFKRGTVWWMEITGANGKPVRKSASTESREVAELKEQLWRMETMVEMGLSPSAKRIPKGMTFGKTWKEASDYWLEQNADKRSHADDVRYAGFWNDKLTGLTLSQLTREKLETVLDAKAKDASKSTANRYRAYLVSVLNMAVDKEWLSTTIRVKRYAEPKGKERFLTMEQIGRLLEELPQHQRDMAEFALATGARQSAVKRLRWSEVNLPRRMAWITPENSKSEKAVPLPLNDRAIAVLQRCAGANREFVFTYEGQPVDNVNTAAWTKALARAGLEGTRWHDLRHTWASHHAMNGTPLQALQTMGGWSDPKMVRRYAHFSPESLGGFAGNAPV